MAARLGARFRPRGPINTGVRFSNSGSTNLEESPICATWARGGLALASRLCCLFVTTDEQVAQRVQSMLTPARPRQKLSTLERVTISPQLEASPKKRGAFLFDGANLLALCRESKTDKAAN